MWEVEGSDTAIAPPVSIAGQRGTAYLWKVEARTGWDRWVASELVEFSASAYREDPVMPSRRRVRRAFTASALAILSVACSDEVARRAGFATTEVRSAELDQSPIPVSQLGCLRSVSSRRRLLASLPPSPQTPAAKSPMYRYQREASRRRSVSRFVTSLPAPRRHRPGLVRGRRVRSDSGCRESRRRARAQNSSSDGATVRVSSDCPKAPATESRAHQPAERSDRRRAQ